MKCGDIYWIDLTEPKCSEPGYRQPVVVVQSDTFNGSGINTAVVAAVSSNLNRENLPGNILLPKRESSLPKDSVINVSQLITLNKRELDEKLGNLGKRVLGEVENEQRLLLDL